MEKHTGKRSMDRGIGFLLQNKQLLCKMATGKEYTNMLKKIRRKMPAVLAACMLAVCMAPSSFAVGPGNMITVIDTNENHAYTAYKIFKGTPDSQETTLSNIQWGDGVEPAGLLAAAAAAGEAEDSPLYGKFSGVTADTTAAELGRMLEGLSNEEARAFAGMAAKHVTDNGYTGYYQSGTYNIPVIDPGYYIVVDSLVNADAQEMYSGYIVRVVTNTIVSPKISVPTIDKKVYDSDSGEWSKGADHSIGEDIHFKVTIQLPDNFKDYEKYTCIVNDKLSAGLTFDRISGCSVDGRGVTEQYYTSSVNNNVLTVNIDAIGAGAADSSVIELEYVTVLNSAAASGDPENNEVTLTYSNDPTNSHDSTLTSDTPDDVVHVYTYRLDIAKQLKGTAAPLPGAFFILSREMDHATEYAVISNGKMEDWTQVEAEASRLESVSDGSISLDGLGDGTYQLTEVQAPDGYDLLEEPITIVLDGKQDEQGLLSSLTCSASGQGLLEGSVQTDMEEGSASMIVENTKGSLLPSTGGAGTFLFFGCGMLLIGAAGTVTVIRRRRKIEE